MLSGPSLTNKQKAEVLLLSVWLWIVCSILLGKFIAPRGHERYLLSFIEFACGESMGNSQSIDLIVDPANQSEITDVSVLGFFSLFFFLEEVLVAYFQKIIWTSVFRIPECFANQVSHCYFQCGLLNKNKTWPVFCED